jgi:hypothetical protein
VSLFFRFRVKRAAKRYAKKLGGRLRYDFGASEFYSPQQIASTAAKLGLPPKYVVLGYAAFLSEAAFDKLAGTLPVSLPYHEARALCDRFVPSEPTSAGANPEMNVYVQTGVRDGHLPH